MAEFIYTPVRTIGELAVGSNIVTESRTIRESDLHFFCGLVGDANPIHVSDTFAAKNGFEKILAPATLVASMAIALFGSTRWLSPVLMFFVGMSDWRVEHPVHPGDTIFAKVTLDGIRATSDGQRHVLRLVFEVFASGGPHKPECRVMIFAASWMAKDQNRKAY
jgi:acyl dehydratase